MSNSDSSKESVPVILDEGSRIFPFSKALRRTIQSLRNLSGPRKLHFFRDGIEIDITCECEGGQACPCKGECKEKSRFRDIYSGSPICGDCSRNINPKVLETEEDYIEGK